MQSTRNAILFIANYSINTGARCLKVGFIAALMGAVTLLTACAGASIGVSLPIGRMGGVGVSVGSGGMVSGSVGVGTGGGAVSVGASGQLPPPAEKQEKPEEVKKQP
jgi:quinol-cytochrome oxidoreductase complex cytochrome b subunit